MKTEISRKTTKSSKKKTQDLDSSLFLEIKNLKDEPMLVSEDHTGYDPFLGVLLLED